MNKIIALKIADNKLISILKRETDDVIRLLNESEYELVTKDGVEYQVRANAFYDDKEQKILRVNVSVDDQKFWSTLMPLTRSDFYKINL